jgi:hypothetical protein
MDSPHARERGAQALGEACRPTNQVAHGWDNCAVLGNGPQSKVAKTPALDESFAEHALERALDRMRVGLDAASDLTRVQLLPGSTHEQGKRIAADAAAPDELSSHKAILPRLWSI